MSGYRQVRFNRLSNSPDGEDVGVRMRVKLVMSQECALITRGENYMLGCIGNVVSKLTCHGCLSTQKR